jgi:sugar diacid utilization regulator
MGQVNPDTEKDALRAAGFVPAESYLLICVECVSDREDDHQTAPIRRIAQLLEERPVGGRHRPVVGVVNGRATALIPSDRRVLDQVLQATREIVSEAERWDAEAAGAVGGPAPSLDVVPLMFRRVLRTLGVMRELQLGVDVMSTSEALPYLLLRNDPELLGDLASALDRLDGEPNEVSELEQTVSALADHSGNVVAAARDLHVHRHTVYARMKRIDALTGFSLEDPNDRLVLQLAVKARELLGRSTGI